MARLLARLMVWLTLRGTFCGSRYVLRTWNVPRATERTAKYLVGVRVQVVVRA